MVKAGKTMATHDEIIELIPAYALDALDENEAARVRAHLPTCTTCRRALEDYRRVNEGLMHVAPQVEPPPALKARTLGPLEGTALADGTRQPSPVLRQRWNWGAIAAGLAFALALVALAVSLGQSSQVARELAEQRDLIVVIAYADGPAQTIHGTAAAPLALGKLYADPDFGTAALIAVNMPPLSPGDTYAVSFLQSDGLQVSAGTFRVDAQGSGWLLVRPPGALDAYRTVIVTHQRGGNGPPIEGEIILQAELDSP
jgi:hypothetical protein